MGSASPTSEHLDITLALNATLQEAFRFGDTDDTSWSFTDQHFRMDIKASREVDTVLLTLTDANGRIVVDNATTRVLHLNVDDATLQAALVPGCYVYDLIMYDESVPPIRVQLLHGDVKAKLGVTED
jgi:hypothetical protein